MLTEELLIVRDLARGLDVVDRDGVMAKCPVAVRSARRRGWLTRVGGEVGHPQVDA